MSETPALPDLDALQRLAEAATPGPWSLDTDANDQQMVLAVEADFWVALCPHQCVRSIEVQAGKNAAHIAALNPTTTLAWIAATRALVAERADLGAQLYAQTERVKHLLDTIDVERTGRKDAEAARDAAREKTARVREALEAARPYVQESCWPDKYADDPAAEVLARIDAALTPTPPQPAARTEEGL